MGENKLIISVQPLYKRILEIDSYESNKSDTSRFIGKSVFVNSAQFYKGAEFEINEKIFCLPKSGYEKNNRRQNLIEIALLSYNLEKAIEKLPEKNIYALEKELPVRELLENINNSKSISYLFPDFKRILINENNNDHSFFKNFGQKVIEEYIKVIPYASEPINVDLNRKGKLRNKRLRMFSGEIDVIKKILREYTKL